MIHDSNKAFQKYVWIQTIIPVSVWRVACMIHNTQWRLNFSLIKNLQKYWLRRCGNSTPNHVSPNHILPKTFLPITFFPIHVSSNRLPKLRFTQLMFRPNYTYLIEFHPNFFNSSNIHCTWMYCQISDNNS